MQLSSPINERALSILDWAEPQSLQRLCVLGVARSLATFVDSVILGHIFKKEYDFDYIVDLIRYEMHTFFETPAALHLPDGCVFA